MVKVHVECLPDETLIRSLGISKRMVEHHAGKARVFHRLKTTDGNIGMVDEDPNSVKHPDENKLILKDERFGIKRYKDQRGNSILILKVKLEDWIIAVCKVAKIDIGKFGLSSNPSELHGMLNSRLPAFKRLINHLVKQGNEHIIQLKNWLSE